MSLPVSITDFFTLAKYYLELGQRIKSLGDDHRHLKARVEYRAIFTDLRTSCYLSLCRIEPTLERFEKLKTDNVVKRKARKFAVAVQNNVDNLKGKLRDQFVILSLMVLRLNQAGPLEASESEQLVFEVKAIQQASEELKQYTKPKLRADIEAIIEE
ncbi:hypothetical protein DL769_007907 [Monosporascus sp. CRB-8-3]|nr:hypothetical protein DL769_007907 [Monosporascus sp. CRB-8-3]